MRVILLIMIGFSTFLSADFTRSDGVVTDNTTNLQWQDNEVGSQMSWESAIAYCEGESSLGGKDDWRLPNIHELRSIIDREVRQPAMPSIFTMVGTNNNYIYWSSTSFVGYEFVAWIVRFEYGYVDGNDKDDSYFVRCVRGGQ